MLNYLQSIEVSIEIRNQHIVRHPQEEQKQFELPSNEENNSQPSFEEELDNLKSDLNRVINLACDLTDDLKEKLILKLEVFEMWLIDKLRHIKSIHSASCRDSDGITSRR